MTFFRKSLFCGVSLQSYSCVVPVKSEPNDIPLNMNALPPGMPVNHSYFAFKEHSDYKGFKVYTKDLTFLLRLLLTSKQSGVLFVESCGQNGSDGSSWQGQFQLDNGVVALCLVRSKTDGQVLFTNEEAVLWLTRQGRLEWHMGEDAQSEDVLLPSLPHYEESRREQPLQEVMQSPLVQSKQSKGIPLRTVRGNTAPVNTFATREQLQVFALVDGRRTIEEIVRLLHKQPDAVIRILQELQTMGFVA